MGFLAQIHIYCFLMSYLAALLGEGFLVMRRNSPTVRTLVIVFGLAGFFAHTAFLITRSTGSGLPPLLTSQQDWLLVLAWMGSLLYVILLLTHRQVAHGLFMLPVILLLILVAIFVSDQASGNLRELSLRRWGMFHATSLVLGIGAVVGSSITGMMYLLHHQRLRSRSGWWRNLRLPSLENLTAWNRWMVVFSVPCLTLGLLTGFLLISWSGAENNQPITWSDPTILTTTVVWLAMVILLVRLLSHSHQTGKAVAQLSLLSGGFLLITLLGPMVLAGSGNLDTFHGRPRSDETDGERDRADEVNSPVSNGSGESPQ